MKSKVKFVSIFLILLFIITPLFQFRAKAFTGDDAALMGPEVHKAWYLQNYSSEYYLHEYTSPYRLWVEKLQQDNSWNQLLLSWRITTFDLKSEIEYSLKEVGYYVTFLFNILYDSTSNSLETSFIDALSDGCGDVEASWKSIGISTWKQFASAYEGVLKDTPIDANDTEQVNAIMSSLREIKDIKGALNVLGEVGNWISYCDTAIDVVEKLSKLESILSCSTETAEILQHLRDRAQTGTPLWLVLDDFCTMLSGTLSPEIIRSILTGEAILEEVCKEMASILWSQTVALAESYGLILKAGQSIGKFTSDTLFNTSATIAEYYKLEAMYRLEDLLRDECNACSRSFTSNPSIETATQFTAAYKLYCKALIEGLNCSLSFFDAALKEGAVAQICYWFNQEELDNIRSTICDLQKTVQDTYNYLDSGAYNSYIFTLEYLEEAGLLEDPAIQEMDIAPLPEVELDLEQAMNDIRSDVFTVSSTHYTEDTVLASDLETYGEITVSGGTLDLGGHTMHVMNNFYLTGGSVQLSGGTLCIDGDLFLDSNIDLLNGTLIVTGNVLHSNGTLYLNKGSLTVSGDYRQQSVGTNSAQEKVYSTSYGKIVMQYDEDLLQVGGDWILQPSSSFNNALESGRIELSGGLQKIASSSQPLLASDTHTIALVGAGPHSMHLDSSDSKIAHLEVEEGAVITWDGYMNAAYMESDCTITSNSAVLTGLNLNGHTLQITGDIEISAGGASVDCLNGSLVIDGNVLHSNGTLYLNKGSLTVSGDYRQQSVGTNSAQEKVYSTSYGKIVMQYDEDLLQVGGDWILQPSSSFNNALESGRIELSGGLQKIASSSQPLLASDTHTIALVGAGPHSMHLDSSDSKIAHLEVEEGAVITWDGYMNAAYMESDCTITSNSAVLTGLNLNGHTLQITGDIEISAGGASVDCLNGSLVIDGNVLHSNGTLYLNKGSLTVSGDYRQQSVGTNSAQEKVYSTSYGKIVMQYEADSLTIGRDMYVQPSYSCGTLTAGTLRIGGNFEQLSGTFAPNGTHTTILNGTGARQIITFSNSYSRFHILDLSRDGTYYEFTPDSCWNSLKEPPFISEVAVTGIRINARTKTMTLGEQFQLTAAVMPENATDPTLCWSSDQESVASVDDTGLVTAVGEGKAVIRVEASNGLYRTCAITVHEVFSGTFEVGSCNALPGETLILPVRVYDNPGFAALQLSVEYDESLLTPVNVTAGSLLATGELRYQTDQNTCRILWYDTQDMTQNGILFYVHFQVNAAADLDTKTSIILHSDYGDICQADHTNISFFMENGTIFIKDVLVGDIYEDEEINVHDILLLQQYLTGLEGLSGRQQVAADLDGDSIVSIKDIVRLAQILLGIPSDSGIPTLQSADPLSIQVINSTVDSSGNVEIPVLFLNCSGIAGLRLQVDYDPALLTLTGIKSSSELKENLCTNLSDPDREATWITWYNATNLHLDGQMLTLCFQLADPNYSGIIPVSVHCNTGDACTEALTTISVDDQYGLVRTDGYSSDVQVQNLMLNVGEKSSILHGSLCCNYDLQGTQVDIIAAVYRGNQLYAAWTGTGILGKEVEIAMDQEIDNGMTVRLFVLQKENYQPLCPVTQLNK